MVGSLIVCSSHTPFSAPPLPPQTAAHLPPRPPCQSSVEQVRRSRRFRETWLASQLRGNDRASHQINNCMNDHGGLILRWHWDLLLGMNRRNPTLVDDVADVPQGRVQV